MEWSNTSKTQVNYVEENKLKINSLTDKTMCSVPKKQLKNSRYRTVESINKASVDLLQFRALLK